MVASASRDQTVRVFDIRTLKEFRILKGHKKEVCCTTLYLSLMFQLIYISHSCNMASIPPHPRLRRLGRCHLALGSRSPRTTLQFLPSSPRNPLPSTRLQRLVFSIPPSRSSPRLRIKRPHNKILVSRKTRRRFLSLFRRRRETTRSG